MRMQRTAAGTRARGAARQTAVAVATVGVLALSVSSETVPSAAATGDDAATAGVVSPSTGVTIGGERVEITGADLDSALFTQVASGDHTIALTRSGALYAWGISTEGSFGTAVPVPGGTSNVPVPVDTSGVLDGKTIVAVSAGDYTSAALDSDGRVYTWGRGSAGQLGNGSRDFSRVPVAVDGLDGTTIVQIAVGKEIVVALDEDGLLYSWGAIYDSASAPRAAWLGTGDEGGSAVPVPVAGGALTGRSVDKICVSTGSHVLALDGDGKLFGWGQNDEGQLATGGRGAQLSPVALGVGSELAGKTATQLACAADHSLALTDDGSVYAWGANEHGQLANGSKNQALAPTPVDLSVVEGSVTAIGASAEVSWVVMDGRPFGAGSGEGGQLGHGSDNSVSLLTRVEPGGVLDGKTIASVGGVGHHTVAVDAAGQLFAWGYGTYGRLGNGADEDEWVPVQVMTHGAYFGSPEHVATEVDVDPVSGTVTVTTPPHEAARDVGVFVVPSRELRP